MINTNKVLEQIYKLILAYTKDKTLDSNSAKYVLKTAVEKVLEYNNLNIDAAETIVSAIEKSKVLEKIRSLDFNRLSSNKDYFDPLYGKPINVKQVLSIVYGVIDSQIKSLDDVLFDSQSKEVKREINEIKLNPIARFSPNAYMLLSKKTVLFESKDLEEDKENKSKPYKKLLEIAKIIYQDNPLEQIKEIITEFKGLSVYGKKKIDYKNKKSEFVTKILSRRRGKIVEAIFLKNLVDSNKFDIEVEGGKTYVDDILPSLMKEGKSSFNLYLLYNEIISNDSFKLEEATINDVKTFDKFDEYIERIEEFKSYNELCESNIDTFLDKTNEYFESISGKITFGAFKTKFKFSEENIQNFYFIEDESVKKAIDENKAIKNIEITGKCFIPSSLTSYFDFYLDLKITLEDDSDVVIDKGLCVDVKNYTSSRNRNIGITSIQMTSISNSPFVTIANIKENEFQVKTFLTKSLNKRNSTYFKSIMSNTLDSQEDFDESFNDINSFVEVEDKTEDLKLQYVIFQRVKSLRLELKTFDEIKYLINKEFDIEMSTNYYRLIWHDYAEESDLSEYKQKYNDRIFNDRIAPVIKHKLELKTTSEIAEELGISERSVKDYWQQASPEDKARYLEALEASTREKQEKVKQNVIKLKLQLKTEQEIAEELKIGKTSVQKYWAKASDGDKAKYNEARKASKREKQEKEKQNVIKLKIELKTVPEISKELGISESSVEKHWAKASSEDKARYLEALEARKSNR